MRSTPPCARSPGAAGLSSSALPRAAFPSVKANYLLLKNIEISGLQISDYRKRRPDRVAECFRELFAFYEAGRIRPPATIALPLDRAAEGLAMVRDRTTEGRRVILLPQGAADGGDDA